jgi:hypothetical protein
MTLPSPLGLLVALTLALALPAIAAAAGGGETIAAAGDSALVSPSTTALASGDEPTGGAAGSEPEYFFYKRLPYGSDRLTSPLRLILNGGFGILQVENRSNQLSDIDYRNGWKNLWKNLLHPIESIENKGWWDFVSSEIIPVSVNSGNAQYWPNYMNHLIGGGFSYRLMREWYRAHGFVHETTWSISTMVVYHLVNETVEMDSKTGWRVDPVADIYVFDVGGIILFSSDRVSRFFSHKLHMSDWSFQPFYDPWNGTLQNVGLNYMVRLRLGRTTPWHLFYQWSNGGELGVSRQLGGDHYLSCGAGWVAKNIVDVDGISETAKLATSFGVFYDRSGSLLASVLYAKEKDNRWRLNLYPGLLRIGPFQPGLTFGDSRRGDLWMGVTFGRVPLVPVGLGGRIVKSG